MRVNSFQEKKIDREIEHRKAYRNSSASGACRSSSDRTADRFRYLDGTRVLSGDHPARKQGAHLGNYPCVFRLMSHIPEFPGVPGQIVKFVDIARPAI